MLTYTYTILVGRANICLLIFILYLWAISHGNQPTSHGHSTCIYGNGRAWTYLLFLLVVIQQAMNVPYNAIFALHRASTSDTPPAHAP